MKMVLRSLAFCLSLLLAQAPVSAQNNDLEIFVARVAAVHEITVEGSAVLVATDALDTRISSIYFDEKPDPEVDAAIETYVSDVEQYLVESRATLAEVNAGMEQITSKRERALITGMSENVEVLHTILEGTPDYLRDLLKAARADDAETFDRLSRQSMARYAALLRTDNTLMEIQQSRLKDSHPSYALLSSVKASNEGMALFFDAGARIFANADAKAEETADAMRGFAGEMRTAIAHGQSLRKAMLVRLFIPAMRNKGAAGIRRVIDKDFDVAFAVEVDAAAHLEAMANALETIYDGDTEEMEALDAITVELANRRNAIRQTILQNLQDASSKLK